MRMTFRAFAAALAAVAALAPSRGFATNTMTAAQRRAELRVVASDYVDKGPEFDAPARRRAHALIARASADAVRLTDQDYLLRLAEVAAQADNGHDSVNFMSSPLYPESRLPVRLTWIGERLFVARAGPGYHDLAGGEVLRLGRWTPAELARNLSRYQGGADAYRRWNPVWLFHNPVMLRAMGASVSANRVSIRVRGRDGTTIVRRLSALPTERMPRLAFPSGLLSPVRSDDEVAKDWVAATSAAAPLYLQRPERYFRLAELPELDGLYVQFRANFDMGDEKIAPFVATVEQRLTSNPPNNLVLDLRFDTGGDNTQNRDLMRHIAEKVRGRIFVLTGPYTFSAGIASEAALVHDGGAKVTVMGAEPGDRDHWWSEHKPVCLPYSKICLDREMGHWDLVRGCAGEAHCYGDQFDAKVETLAPSIRHELTPAEWLQGMDPLMEEVRRILRPTKS
jgi:hypothetical protein